MIFGTTRFGANPVDLAADTVRVAGATLEEPMLVSYVGAYLDGLGPNGGAALLRAVVYDADENLVLQSDEREVDAGDAPLWLQFRISDQAAFRLDSGDYEIGLQVGGSNHVARTYVDDPGGDGSLQAPDTYADGPEPVRPAPTAVMAASLPVYVAGFAPWSAPNVEDDALARLSWGLSQQALGAAGSVRNSRVSARVGWHGTSFDEETGAFAVVRSDGPLADLVGERIRVTRRTGTHTRSVVVYVHSELAFPDEVADEDLSLTMRAFLGLAAWSADRVDAVVEVLA